mmetsp:Transcript_4732/g.8131  ORF Transcript_4732/g.8131 Transcript_4732/m.8131 type:complete len:95 (+) Transcript_4732:529-813(+)
MQCFIDMQQQCCIDMQQLLWFARCVDTIPALLQMRQMRDTAALAPQPEPCLVLSQAALMMQRHLSALAPRCTLLAFPPLSNTMALALAVAKLNA